MPLLRQKLRYVEITQRFESAVGIDAFFQFLTIYFGIDACSIGIATVVIRTALFLDRSFSHQLELRSGSDGR